MGKAFLYGNGGGGSGGTLVVSAPVGVTVIATNEVIGKTYKRTANAAGIATFKGLATGVWSLSISDGKTTSTPVSVEVNADYEITLAFFSAEIVVTYPANSTCTCSDGTTTFTDINSTDSVKTVTFTVPNDGKWTITATANDGSGDSAEKTVEITAEGQSKSVKLVYWNGELYDAGNEYTAITGGWTSVIVGIGSVTKNSDHLYLTTGSSQNSGQLCNTDAVTENPVDLSEFSVLKMTISEISSNAGGAFYLYVTTASGKAWASGVPCKQFGAKGTIELDVSGLTGKYYVGCHLGPWPNYWTKVTKMWLE